MNLVEIELPPDVRQRLEAQARQRGKTISEMGRELIESGLRGCPEAAPRTAVEILRAMGRLSTLSDDMRKMIIPGVTIDEVRDALSAAGGPSLSEIIDEQRGPKT